MSLGNKILLVDDDTKLLAGVIRLLGDQFNFESTETGETALEKIRNEGPFAAILCDMRMPGVDGIEVLHRVSEIAPDTVRMMLTGNADQATAAEAINQGHVFRFFNKPISGTDLSVGFKAAIHHYNLITAERQLLNKTLTQSVNLLTEILTFVAPEIFDQSHRIKPWARDVAEEMQLPELWILDMAVELSDLGAITVPDDILRRHKNGARLSPVEEEMIARIPESGAALIRKIPRLTPVADVIQHQRTPMQLPNGKTPTTRVEARILNVLLHLDEISSGVPSRDALYVLAQQKGRFDPDVLAAVGACIEAWVDHSVSETATRMDITAAGLCAGDILLSDLKLASGQLVLATGERITDALFLRLQNLIKMTNFHEPIRIKRQMEAKAR